MLPAWAKSPYDFIAKHMLALVLTMFGAIKTHLGAMERHLPYGIAHCYQPPSIGVRAVPKAQPDGRVLDLSTPV